MDSSLTGSCPSKDNRFKSQLNTQNKVSNRNNPLWRISGR